MGALEQASADGAVLADDLDGPAKRDLLIAQAVDRGALLAHHADTYRRLYDENPELYAHVLADMPGHEFAQNADGLSIEPEGMTLHTRAETWLRKHGKVNARGELAYSYDDYVRALQELELDDCVAAIKAEEEAGRR